MSLISQIKSLNVPGCALLIGVLALVGCNREQIKTEQVPKESSSAVPSAPPDTAGAPAMPVNPHAGMDMSSMGGESDAQLGFVLPNGWEKKPLSQMRVGSFSAPGKDGQSADVSIIPLPSGGPEMDLANLNMWRGELQLPKADKDESEPVTIGSAQGKLYDIGGGKSSDRIMVAVLDRDGMSYYFKMRGEDATVREQKPAFLEFLKSISFQAAPAVATGGQTANPNVMPSVEADANQPLADAGVPLPTGWKQVPAPSGFLLAKYDIQGAGDAQAEVNVSELGGQGGGMLMNINRWRGQLGLTPVSEEDWSKQARTIDIGGSQATVVDLTGTDAKTGKPCRLIGVIAPQSGDTWFYKLMGNEQIVEQQKDAFTKFVQTAKFSNAP